jgi:hypothetical protein
VIFPSRRFGRAGDFQADADTWCLAPETCLSLFSSTSPDEPSLFIKSWHFRSDDSPRDPRRTAPRPCTGQVKPAVLYFHRHPRMNLHFCVFLRIYEGPAPRDQSGNGGCVLLTPDISPLKFAFLCFHQHPRMNLHFRNFRFLLRQSVLPRPRIRRSRAEFCGRARPPVGCSLQR